MNVKQLFEKVAKGYIPIYPLASMDNIVDENQSISLTEVLNKYNHIYVTFADDAKETRLLIPDFLRRYGLWLSYEKDGNLYTEFFKGSNVDAQQEERWSGDEYWEYVPDLQYINDASKRIPNGAILPEHLSDSLKQLLSQHHTINNMVDDEDLETKGCGIIKFKDRPYQPNIASGKGYKILRKDFYNGINTLTVEDFEWQNTIYEVRYDFDLQGQTINLPKGATLLFKGGAINNGSVYFNGGTIIGADKFSDCGNASFTGEFSKGLIMSFDDTPKWWNGTEWVAFASGGGEEPSGYEAEVVSVETTDNEANATVKLAGKTFSFTFAIPRGKQGPQGIPGPVGPAGADGIDGQDGKDGKDGTIEGFNANAEAETSDTPKASVTVNGTTLNFKFGLVKGETGEQGPPGKDGTDGADGKDAVLPNWKTYIYIKADSKPAKPTSTDILPSGWSDYPTSTGQWWQCIGTVNGITNKVVEWSEVLPVNGKDGTAQDGSHVEMRFAINNSRTDAPTLNVDERNPSGWTIQPPSVGDSNYLWMTTATIGADDSLKTNWTTPVCISGEQGPKGETGPAGPSGPAGSQGVSGIHGVSIELRYCLGTDTTYDGNSNPIGDNPTGWNTDIPVTTEEKPYIWCIQGRREYNNSTDTVGHIIWGKPFRLNGVDGLDGIGKKGQIIYPAGIYNNDTVYITDENKAPYVLDTTDNNFYVLNAQMSWKGSEQDNKTPSQDYTINKGKYWLKFDAFEAVYTKIGIIANGLIGSAVFNGDYMFSQQGINPSSSNAITTHYENFDKDYIYNGTFTPNIMFNFATGAGHLAAGKIKFDESGDITLNNLYMTGYVQENYKVVTSGATSVDFDPETKNYIFTETNTNFVTIDSKNMFKSTDTVKEINIYNGGTSGQVNLNTYQWDDWDLNIIDNAHSIKHISVKPGRCVKLIVFKVSDTMSGVRTIIANKGEFMYDNDEEYGGYGIISKDLA